MAYDRVIDAHRPSTRALPKLFSFLRTPQTPNAKKGIVDRFFNTYDESLKTSHFLSGFLSALRYTKTKNHTVLMHEGKKLLSSAEDLRGSILTVDGIKLGNVKKMRRLDEAILRFVTKAEKELEKTSR